MSINVNLILDYSYVINESQSGIFTNGSEKTPPPVKQTGLRESLNVEIIFDTFPDFSLTMTFDPLAKGLYGDNHRRISFYGPYGPGHS